MTGTDFCVNKPHMSRSYLKHLVLYNNVILDTFRELMYVVLGCRRRTGINSHHS